MAPPSNLVSPTRLVLLVATCLCVVSGLLLPCANALQPVCSYASSARPAKFASGSSGFTSSQGSYAQYAETAFTNFINSMYNFQNRNLYIEFGSTSPSNYWNTAIGIQALLQYASFHAAHGISGQGWGAPSVVSTVQDIVNTQLGESNENDNQLRDAYMDDMSWMIHGLTLLYQSPNANQAQYITLCNGLLAAIQSQDDTSCCGSHPGGVWWDTSHSSKVTAAQLGVTVAALRMRETGAYNSSYSATLLSYAQSHYSFWKSFMVNTNTGQWADHEDTQGDITWWGFTYNNGLGLGAAVHLYQATNNAAYLTDASSWASYLLNGMQVSVSGSTRTILNNDCGGCDGDCSQFHQVSFHYLAEYYTLLYQQAQQAGSGVTQSQTDALCNVYSFLQSNIDSLWINARNSSTGTFNCNWNAPFSSGVNGLQGAMNSAVSATALFASTPLMSA